MKIKRFLLLAVALCLCIGLLVVTASASEIVASGNCGSNGTYTLTSDGTLTISGNGFVSCNVYSSSYIKNLPWYNYRKDITTVVIEEGVTGLGEYTFYECTSLENVYIPKSLKSVGGYSFAYTAPDNIYITDLDAFVRINFVIKEVFGYTGALVGYDYTSNPLSSLNYENIYLNGKLVTEIVFPADVTEIQDKAFYCCNLEKVSFRGKDVSVGYLSFYKNQNLSQVDLTNVQSIGKEAFSTCTALKEVTFGTGLNKLGAYAFHKCTNLKVVRFQGNHPTIESTSFKEVIAAAFYPAGNRTWTSSTLKTYGGMLYWNDSSYTDHVFRTTYITATGCTDPYVTINTCLVCGYEKREETPGVGHDFKYTYVNPTCTAAGKTTATCKKCGLKEVTNVPAKGHLYEDKVIDPTCTSGGSVIKGCMNCSYAYVDREMDPLGHTPAVTTPAIAPTCTETGWTEGTDCSVCKVVLTRPTKIAATGHAMDDGVVTREPTEEKTGLKVYTCIHCGHKTEVVLDMLAHTHKYEIEVTAPTCTKDGYTTHTCKCGESKRTDIVSATGHSWDQGVVTKEPTEQEIGLKVYTCANCGEKNEEVLPRLAHTHKYQSVVTQPTCTEEGYTTYTCACGATERKDYVSATGHAYENNVCRNCGDKQITVSAPKVTTSNVASSGKIKLSWNKVDGAVKYEIWRATSKNGNYQRLTTTKNTSATNNNTVAGKTYYYYIISVDASGNKSSQSNIVSRTCDLAQPTITVSNRASDGAITVKWEKVEGATKYEVYRATSKSGTYSKVTTTSKTSYTSTSGTAGKTYYYKVRAICDKEAAASAYSEILSGVRDLAQPTITVSNRASDGAVTIKWEKIAGATKYEIWRATSRNGTYTRVGTTSNTSYNNTSGTVGKTYYYKVRAICDKEAAASAYSEVLSGARDLASPKAKVALKSKKPYLSCDKVTNATKYQVYRATSKNGTYKLVSTTTNRYYKDTKATKNKTYYYKVVAVCKTTAGNSAYSGVVSIKSK